MSNPTFRIYIDESGDEGFSFNRGSSEWFVISAIITKKEFDLDELKLIDRVKNQLGKDLKKPLHFCDLKHEQRLPFVSEIAKANLRSVSVLIHKPSLKEPEKFRERYRLYFYSVRYLLERASWYCRDHKAARDMGDGSAEIYFSNRSGMSYAELVDYLEQLHKRTDFYNCKIDWSVINNYQILALSSGKLMGLQVAMPLPAVFSMQFAFLNTVSQKTDMPLCLSR